MTSYHTGGTVQLRRTNSRISRTGAVGNLSPRSDGVRLSRHDGGGINVNLSYGLVVGTGTSRRGGAGTSGSRVGVGRAVHHYDPTNGCQADKSSRD